jgi:hypothetical protein
MVRRFLAENPFNTLQVVIDTDRPFPFDVFEELRAACSTAQNDYLERFYEFTPGRRAGSRRVVVVAPQSARSQFDAAWLTDADEHCDVVWTESDVATAAAR